ncbi:type VI secretion system protein TssA [Niveibacterium sp. 24ML]|uniref:type VI secretion system protein TssA n=1 Tax=Niveibacterium sp. 24ML TaxID=2985512 RepID=UPI00226D9BF8|nr:type VI secretion system protein TssA [Niveibacterium sp. 24ML]MCX9156622.1 type VI secretion system protein TssA [Niveibacterium sp. 24ML]
MDLEGFLKPVSDSSPCGPNLEYDAAFLELEEAARAQPDQEFGTDDGSGVKRIEGSGPDWPQVNRLASALLSRSKDLRIAIHLLRASTHTSGFSGFAEGVSLIKALLEQYWDALHPELDADDDNDPTMRVNALAPLVAPEAVLGDIREAWLVRTRQAGAVTVRDIEVLAGRLPARPDTSLSETQITGMLSRGIAEDPELPARVRATFDTIKAIEAFVSDKVGGAQSIDLKPIQATLYSVRQLLDRIAPQAAPSADEPGEVAAEPTGISGGTVVVSRPGEIRSREDVVTTLEKVCEYLSRTEPSNPVQLVLRRAQRMMNMNFLELLNDLAPDGLPQAEKVVGAKLEEE